MYMVRHHNECIELYKWIMFRNRAPVFRDHGSRRAQCGPLLRDLAEQLRPLLHTDRHEVPSRQSIVIPLRPQALSTSQALITHARSIEPSAPGATLVMARLG